MTEKEFRKLKTLDLIQILLTQGNEEARLQAELEKQKEHLAQLREYNDGLKTALNDKDALIETLKQDLNQSDADIQGLREELKELYTDKMINLENIGSLTEVAKRVNDIFEAAQREAEEYLAHPERVRAISENSCPEAETAPHGIPVIDSANMDNTIPEAEEHELTNESSNEVICETAPDVNVNASGNIEKIIDDAQINTESGEDIIAEPSVNQPMMNTEISEESLSEEIIAGGETESTPEPVSETAAKETIDTSETESIPNSASETTMEETIDTAKPETTPAQDPNMIGKQEHQHHKTATKKNQSNKNWLKKLISHMKR